MSIDSWVGTPAPCFATLDALMFFSASLELRLSALRQAVPVLIISKVGAYMALCTDYSSCVCNVLREDSSAEGSC